MNKSKIVVFEVNKFNTIVLDYDYVKSGIIRSKVNTNLSKLLFVYRDKRWTCWIAKRPILYNAHDAATNNGRAMTNKRVSIN